ncbi:MAG: cyclic nucleotide-binding domain-containing protein [Verrucomicrobiota bacterium]
MSDSLSKPELPAVGFAADITEEDRQLLSGWGEFLPVQKDAVLITEGDRQDSLYFIISGQLHAFTSTDGRRILLGRLGPGDTIGEVNIFDPGTASASVSSVEFSQVWRLDREMADSLVKEEPAVASVLLVNIATQLSKRLRETNEKVSYVKKALGDPSFLS